jgi:hypothetical protein
MSFLSSVQEWNRNLDCWADTNGSPIPAQPENVSISVSPVSISALQKLIKLVHT